MQGVMERIEVSPFQDARFWAAMGWNMLWINVSEVFRYFVFVMPMMRAAFPDSLNVAPMDVGVFLSWAVWDTLLVLSVTLGAWLALRHFGQGLANVLSIGTGIWAAIFGILWLGLFNLNLAPASVLAVALPLAWLEMVVAVWITRRCLLGR